jgi:hypothetical protein
MTQRIKHQLFIHMDYEPSGILEVRYSYPLSTPPIGEHVVRLQGKQVPKQLRSDIEAVVMALSKRITTQPIRAPHAIIIPNIVLGGTTIVIQDQTRANEIPHARIYYNEVVKQLGIGVERELHMGPTDFTGTLQMTWQRIQAKIKGIAWQDYTGRVGPKHLFPMHVPPRKGKTEEKGVP